MSKYLPITTLTDTERKYLLLYMDMYSYATLSDLMKEDKAILTAKKGWNETVSNAYEKAKNELEKKDKLD